MAANDELTRLRAENEELREMVLRLTVKDARKRLQAALVGVDQANARLAEASRNKDDARKRVERVRKQVEREDDALKDASTRMEAAYAGVQEANARFAEAGRDKAREEDALKDYLASRSKRARVEESEDAAAPETKTKRKRASD